MMNIVITNETLKKTSLLSFFLSNQKKMMVIIIYMIITITIMIMMIIREKAKGFTHIITEKIIPSRASMFAYKCIKMNELRLFLS